MTATVADEKIARERSDRVIGRTGVVRIRRA
jgi:hypothetical protein